LRFFPTDSIPLQAAGLESARFEVNHILIARLGGKRRAPCRSQIF
jgi:hypothetical protein